MLAELLGQVGFECALELRQRRRGSDTFREPRQDVRDQGGIARLLRACETGDRDFRDGPQHICETPGERREAGRLQGVGAQRFGRRARACELLDRTGDLGWTDPAFGQLEQLIRRRTGQGHAKPPLDHLADDRLERFAIGIHGERGVEAGLHRVAGEDAAAERVDRAHDEAVEADQERAGADDPRRVLLGERLREDPLWALIFGDGGERLGDPGCHLGRRGLRESDRHDTLEDACRHRLRPGTLGRRPGALPLGEPALGVQPPAAHRPRHDPCHERRGLAGAGAGDEQQRALEARLGRLPGAGIGLPGGFVRRAPHHVPSSAGASS